MSAKFATVWFQTNEIPEAELREVLKANANNIAFRQLKKIIRQKLNELNNLEVSLETYQTPNWSLLQADYAGQKRTLKNLDNLLSWVNE